MLFNISYFLCHLFSLQSCAARVNFPAIYFLYFVARNSRPPSLFFVNIVKDKPSKRKNAQLGESRSMYFYLLAYQLKKFLQIWKNPNVGW